MSVSDPIADMLTCIRNAAQAQHKKVDVPASRVKEEILKVLQREKFIRAYRRVEDNKQGVLRVYLQYTPESDPVISHLKRISKPGRRIYVTRDEIPRVQNGLGSAILSTSRGVMTDREARKVGVGGELIAEVY
ncbi:MAG: 30S ribosomal protein S8 [Candidatus Eisenbacteria bacterium]|uniref:Small ribosomal subunit protein uS8 n=1 Tax=Eiseniibacteriota bacterium TaxID=2212470 RepID=A0A956LY46_UNCEI|nr:30S ribosomal protein S8 [Candidatus Eisenbacteria bacterium]